MLVEDKTIRSGADRRRHKRIALLHSALLREGERVIDCVIRDISMSGARLLIEQRIAEQQDLVLDIAGVGRLTGQVVWQRADEAGLRFLDEPGMVKSHVTAAWGADLG